MKRNTALKTGFEGGKKEKKKKCVMTSIKVSTVAHGRINATDDVTQGAFTTLN